MKPPTGCLKSTRFSPDCTKANIEGRAREELDGFCAVGQNSSRPTVDHATGRMVKASGGVAAPFYSGVATHSPAPWYGFKPGAVGKARYTCPPTLGRSLVGLFVSVFLKLFATH